jgi:O-6-methylguanine DNA methyltransferase
LLLNSTSNSSARTGVSLLGSGLTFSNAEEKVMNLLLTKTKEAGKAYATPEDRWNAVVQRDRNASEIAERIGSPQAVRAVAQACASNTIAVAIPCHRILRADDDISGYRWGVERKRALLEREVAA